MTNSGDMTAARLSIGKQPFIQSTDQTQRIIDEIKAFVTYVKMLKRALLLNVHHNHWWSTVSRTRIVGISFAIVLGFLPHRPNLLLATDHWTMKKQAGDWVGWLSLARNTFQVRKTVGCRSGLEVTYVMSSPPGSFWDARIYALN